MRRARGSRARGPGCSPAGRPHTPSRGADVLYAGTLSSFPYCLLAGWLARVPQVVHVYSSYGDGAAYRKHLLRRARHVIAPSADSLALERRALGEFAPRTRARVVYNGMDVERIVRAAAAPLPGGMAPGGGPTVGMVGHLDARKNPALLLEAIAEVRAAVPGARALLVGAFRDRASERTVRERARTLGLADAVAVTGFLAYPFPCVDRVELVYYQLYRRHMHC